MDDLIVDNVIDPKKFFKDGLSTVEGMISIPKNREPHKTRKIVLGCCHDRCHDWVIL